MSLRNLADYLTKFAFVLILLDILYIIWRFRTILNLVRVSNICCWATIGVWFLTIYWLWGLSFFARWDFCVSISASLRVLVRIIASIIIRAIRTSAVKLLLLWTIKWEIDSMLFLVIKRYLLGFKKFILNFWLIRT